MSKTNETKHANKEMEEVRTRVTALELIELGLEEQPYLIQDLIPKVGLFAIAGTSDCGKSSILRQMAITVAIGSEDFIGFKINDPESGVLYLSTEDDMESTAVALHKGYAKFFNVPPQSLSNLVFEFDEGDDSISYVENALKQANGEIKLVIVDAYSDVLKGDSNRFENVRGFLNEFKKLAIRYQCAIGFLHHIGKGKEGNSPNKSSILGSQGFEAKMRLVTELRPDESESNVRYFSILKANSLRDEIKRYAYKLLFEDMVFENTGEVVEKSSLGQNGEYKPNWLDEAIKLHQAGKTYEEVAKQLLSEGFANCSKSTIGRYLKDIDQGTTDVEE